MGPRPGQVLTGADPSLGARQLDEQPDPGSGQWNGLPRRVASRKRHNRKHPADAACRLSKCGARVAMTALIRELCAHGSEGPESLVAVPSSRGASRTGRTATLAPVCREAWSALS